MVMAHFLPSAHRPPIDPADARVCLPDGTTCIGSYITQDDITKLCQNALDAAGRAIEDKLSQLDAPGMMSISDGEVCTTEERGTVVRLPRRSAGGAERLRR